LATTETKAAVWEMTITTEEGEGKVVPYKKESGRVRRGDIFFLI